MTAVLPELAGVTHRHAEVNGFRMHWAEAGDPASDPIVLLHGWPQHWLVWRHQIGPLSEHRRVIVPDLRGHGWSEAPEGSYAKAEFVADVVGLLDHLGIERADLVGHDWGGWTTLLLSILHPDRVRRAVLFNIAHPFGRPNARTLPHIWRFGYQWLMATPVLGEAALRRGMVKRLIGMTAKPDAMPDDVVASYDDVMRQPANARAASQLYRTFTLRELPGVIGGRWRKEVLTTPTLLLFGTDDRLLHPDLLDRDSPALAHQAPNLEFELLDGVGHFIIEEAPDVVLDRIRGFLDIG